MEEHTLQFVVVPPTFGKKQELCTLNTIPRWYRWAKTKIKNEFKLMLEEWFLPEWEDNPYKKAVISYTILRTNGKKMDSDALALTYKWFQDLLVENGYLVDDDQVKVILNPTRLNVEGSVETSIAVEIKLYERYTMTIEELKEKVHYLASELEFVGGDKHKKASSARARKILGEIKNATPQLRRDMVTLDKR